MDSISRVLPVDWTVAIQGGRGTTGKQPLLENPNWAKGFDIVVHNQCFADTTDEALIKRITSAHKGGPPAIVIHCAMHTYRASTNDTWREFLGVTTRRHTKAHNISVKVAAKDHAIMKGFKEDWVTPVDELYVLDKFWPNSVALASGREPGGPEGISARVDQRLRRHAHLRHDPRPRQRHVERPGVSGSARARVQVDGEAGVRRPRAELGDIKGDSHG